MEAEDYLNIDDRVKRAYECPGNEGNYHVTKQANWRGKPVTVSFDFSPKILERKLKEERHYMSTVREEIIEFMNSEYKRTKEYKRTTAEIADHLFKLKGTHAGTVGAQMNTLKREGIIVTCGEVGATPKDRRKFYALTEHVNKEIKKMEEKKKKALASTVTPSIPPAAPAPVTPKPSAIISPVERKLDEVLSILKTLADPESDLIEHMGALIHGALTAQTTELRKSMLSVEGNLTGVIKFKDSASVHNIAHAVNERLANLTFDDAFIYRIREELDDRAKQTEKTLNSALFIVEENTRGNIIDELEKLKRNLPEGYENLSDSDKYKEGMKAGIMLAVEMGIKL